ncbi:MAG TPA: hypothetical protein VLB84_02170 [Bacteroidia bacterium]|nr:hypothetical protein [Bacteroidia bacterium]
MKKLITLFYLFFIAISGIAQVDSTDYSKKNLKHNTAAERVSASVSMGTGMIFSKSAPTAVSTYIAPSIGYRVTKKINLSVGIVHYSINGNSFINRGLNDYRFARNTNYISGNLIQFQGHYQMNEKTLVSGSVLYDMNSFSPTKQSYKGASIGLDYKLTPHTTFSVRTTVIQGNGYNNPFSLNPIGTSAAGLHPMNAFNPYPSYVSPFNF